MIVVEQFWRCVWRGTAERVEVMSWSGDLSAEAKISKLHVIFIYHENVFSFHIAVDIAQMMLWVRIIRVFTFSALECGPKVSPCAESRVPTA